MSPSDAGPAARARLRGARRAAALLAILAATTALVLVGRGLATTLVDFAAWVEALGPWGPAAFVVGYVLATVLMVPALLLTLAAGVLFGVVLGTLYTFVGAVLGSLVAFLVARHLARGAVERRLASRPAFARIDRAVSREGRKIVLLLRLSPVVPYNLLNYALGLTRVSVADYLAASIGMLPATLLYVASGATLGSVAAAASGSAAPRSVAGWALLALGLAATVAVTAVLTRIARRALAAAGAADAPDAA